MTSKAQKQNILKLNLKEKKLTRLFYSQQLSNADSVALNYIYQQKQVLHFRYGLLGAGLFSLGTNYALFRYSSPLFQFFYFSMSMLATHMMITSRLNMRFNTLVQPYFEKYKIK